MGASGGSQSLISVRNLKENDLELLHQWLNAPHLKPYYMQEPISLAKVRRKFHPRTEGLGDIHSLIVSNGQKPYGYIQWYLNRSIPTYGVGTIGQLDGVSFDYFIGDLSYLGRGLGPAILVSAMDAIIDTLAPVDQAFFVGHEPQNKVAIKCSMRAGFVRINGMDFVESDKIHHLFSCDKRT